MRKIYLEDEMTATQQEMTGGEEDDDGIGKKASGDDSKGSATKGPRQGKRFLRFQWGLI